MKSAAGSPRDTRGRTGWWLRLAVLTAVAGVLWFYFWTVQSTGAIVRLTGQRNDYYNLLVDGFLDGHLYMKDEPDPQLLALPPAQRPGNAPFQLDASLYGGHYYLYFGVTPVITLGLPYVLLTGHDFPEALAGVVFMGLGFALAAAWWLGLRRQFFPQLGGGWTVLGVVAIGICTAAPSALRRPLFYEVAIGAGYAFSMLALWAATTAWRRPARGLWWLALAGVAVGLAVGSRANLAPPGVALLCAAAWGVRRERNGPRWRAVLVALLAAGGGAGAVGVGLASYNYARFGSITEFGHHYQLGLIPKQMFRVSNLAYNFSTYYLKPPALNGYFPFVAQDDEDPKPVDYVGREHAHGEWLWTLVVAVSVMGAAVAWVRRRRERGSTVWLKMLALPALWFGVSGPVVWLTGVRSNRYMVDFQPALVLATLGALAFGLVGFKRWRRVMLFAAAAVLLPAAILFNILASMESHRFFQGTAPVTYARLATWADGVAWPLLRGWGEPIGDRDVSFYWPAKGSRGGREVLLTTGTMDFRDTIFLDYDGRERVRLITQHGEYGEVAGEWFDYAAAKRSTLRISGSLLLPGTGHPWYGNRPIEEREALKRRLRVSVDGRLRFDREMPSFDVSSHQMVWGGEKRATGWIERVTAIEPDDAWVQARARAVGAIRLQLKLPQNRFGLLEPLVQSGGLNAFDSLAVRYVRPGVVQLLHDQLGAGGRWSEEFPVDYDQPQRVEVSLPAANDAGLWEAIKPGSEQVSLGLMRVRWNGREVFRSMLPPLPSRPLSVTLGVNWWNASNVRALYDGEMSESLLLEPLVPALRPGELRCSLPGGEALADERGIWLRLERADGNTAGLLWQRMTESGLTRVGWWEGATVTWLARLAPEEAATLNAQLLIPPPGVAGEYRYAFIELGLRNKGAYAHKTEFFNGSAIAARALRPRDWTGSALRRGVSTESKVAPQLPGRLRMRFNLPVGGYAGSDPLLCAGRAGAADSLFLRAAGGGRYVVGLDHWGLGSVESAPVALRTDHVHTLVIELGSLSSVAGELPPNHVRLVLDGQVVLDVAQPLYAVQPGEVVYGLNPHGMSTSGASFRGEIISVLSRAGADDTR
jgi:hypothetical protein